MTPYIFLPVTSLNMIQFSNIFTCRLCSKFVVKSLLKSPRLWYSHICAEKGC